MTFFQAIVYGVVQGLTEFLPISSTAHLRIVPALAGWDDPGAPFTAVIQLGTTLAIVVYFWRELLNVTVGWLRGLFDKSARGSLESRYGWYLIAATIPIGLLGVLFRHQIETSARNLWVIAITLIVIGVVIAVAERIASRHRSEEELLGSDAAFVGTAQVLSLIPGASRSGVTIAAGLLRGLDRSTAARFSFLLSVPAVVLSGAFEARKIGGAGKPSVGITGLALILAFVVGLASIAWLMRWVSKHSMYLFVWYRLGMGVLLIALLSTSVVAAKP
ncbi:MAG: undecaprenyl-diphosphate phosphatase [Actinomycetia bacterium]|nr:undecaprenyl-diphosphate phosphatase [Actinomycetes bacterium]